MPRVRVREHRSCGFRTLSGELAGRARQLLCERVMKARGCLFLVLLSACASSSPSDDDDGSEASTPDVSTLEAFIDELCAAEVPCCVGGGYSADPKECVTFMRSLTQGAPYDAAQGKACVAGFRAASHDYTICTAGDPGPPACNAVFGSPAGTGQPGAICSDSPGWPCSAGSGRIHMRASSP